MKPASPPSVTIEARTHLYRALSKIYLDNGDRAYDALDPNPFSQLEWLSDVHALYQDGQAVSGRFSPFRSALGYPVSALYLTPLKETAYYETALRPIGNASVRTLSKSDLEMLEVAKISLELPLILADCRANYLNGGTDAFWEWSESQLFNESHLKTITASRTLAKQVYDAYPDIDGLVWDSVQHGQSVPAYVVFGQRRRGDILHTTDALDDINTWKPYARKEVEKNRLVLSPNIAALL